MRRVFYASGSFLTGDSIASAILLYADALTHTSGSDIVEFPVVLALGETGMAAMLVGPASQIATTSEPSLFDDPVDERLVEDLKRRSLAVGARKPLVQGVAVPAGFDEFF